MQTKDYLKSYLLVHSTPIPASAKVTVTFVIDEEIMHCEVNRLEGGQRFLLPEEATQKMIEALLSEKMLHIFLPGYQSSISGEGFAKHFQKLKRVRLENPFRLPF